MTLRNPGRLAIHRRSDEIAFLQHRLRVLSAARDGHGVSESQEVVSAAIQHNGSADKRDLEKKVLDREYDLADELLHTRQTEPLGETLQRRLAMAERICRDLAPGREIWHEQPSATDVDEDQGARNSGLDRESGRERLSEVFWVAETERQALAEMLKHWWAWLRGL